MSTITQICRLPEKQIKTLTKRRIYAIFGCSLMHSLDQVSRISSTQFTNANFISKRIILPNTTATRYEVIVKCAFAAHYFVLISSLTWAFLVEVWTFLMPMSWLLLELRLRWERGEGRKSKQKTVQTKWRGTVKTAVFRAISVEKQSPSNSRNFVVESEWLTTSGNSVIEFYSANINGKGICPVLIVSDGTLFHSKIPIFS